MTQSGPQVQLDTATSHHYNLAFRELRMLNAKWPQNPFNAGLPPFLLPMCSAKPHVQRNVVLPHALAYAIHEAEGELRTGIALFGGLPKPLSRLA